MINFPFYKFSPAGNTTVFLEGRKEDKKAIAHFCSLALGEEGVGGEQAGFVNLAERRLRMAGGEFCANACRAFGALLDFYEQEKDRRYFIHISGMQSPVLLEVKGGVPEWDVTASFSDAGIRLMLYEGNRLLVELPGITHLLLEEKDFPEADKIREIAKKLFAEHDLNKCAASGVVWWRKKGASLEILPFVQVPRANTAMCEKACGSASIALAAALGENAVKILQPSGESVEITRKKDKISLSGPVRLVCAGQIWLPE